MINFKLRRIKTYNVGVSLKCINFIVNKIYCCPVLNDTRHTNHTKHTLNVIMNKCLAQVSRAEYNSLMHSWVFSSTGLKEDAWWCTFLLFFSNLNKKSMVWLQPCIPFYDRIFDTVVLFFVVWYIKIPQNLKAVNTHLDGNCWFRSPL